MDITTSERNTLRTIMFLDKVHRTDYKSNIFVLSAVFNLRTRHSDWETGTPAVVGLV